MSLLLGACLFAAGSTISVASAADFGVSAKSGNKIVRIDTTRLSGPQQQSLSNMHSIDYGSYSWVEVTPAQLEALNAAGVPSHEVERPFTLRLGEVAFDPLVDGGRADGTARCQWCP